MTLREKLEAAVGERAPHAVLKDYPLAVFRAVNSFPANSYLIPEFSLGGKFHADFVALSGASGIFDVEFIELEPIDMPMFKVSGDPTPRLSHALRQVSDWSSFIKRHESFVRESLLEESKRKALLNIQDRETGPICNAGHPVTDSVVMCKFRFHVFMGRRAMLDKTSLERKNSMSMNGDLCLGTWDRFMDFSTD